MVTSLRGQPLTLIDSSGVNFGNVLKKLREEKNMSQERLAELCSLHPSYISLMERNIKKPSIVTLFALAIGLEVKASDMLKEVEEQLVMLWLKESSNPLD